MTNRQEKPKILIIEDTPEHIHILIECLHEEFSITAATDGGRAWQFLQDHIKPDLILLDVIMPGLDGYEICKKLKADARTRDIPVIFMSALIEEQDERRGLEIGGVDYISKPLRPALVRARIRNQLELKRHRDHLEEVVKERTRELLLTQDAAILGLGILAEFRDTETGMHIRRTQSYVGLLARHLQKTPKYASLFTDETLHLLIQSSPLHDIGKVGIPDSILRKPSALTREEFQCIKQHTLYGRDVLQRIEATMQDNAASAFLRFAKEIAYTHHECWDGSGYHGMKGEEIPLSGRLMAVADVYDALTSKRAYKEAFTHDEALRIMTKGDGRTHPDHFDPDILQSFIELNESFRDISKRYQD
ncbi:MAG: rpfG2 [Proteobacteria bacterium]|nr:rpfG2 [Pseudomonadota bacterium]